MNNSFGTALSGGASLGVLPVVVTIQQSAQLLALGGTADFTAIPPGTGPFTYQWQFNGTDLPGATDGSLVLNNVQHAQAGQYAVVVSNGLDVAVSASLPLYVTPIAPWGAGFWNPGFVPYCGQCMIPLDLSNAVAVAAGAYHSLALKPDGTVEAWGFDQDGETNVPPGLSNVVSIAAGFGHSLALRRDGTVAAWGRGSEGQTTVPAGLSNVIAIAAGTYSSLALTADGQVTLWGQTVFAQPNAMPRLTNVVAIAASTFCLALQGDGTVAAWGAGNVGQTNVPSGLSNVVAIAADGSHALALKADGTIVAWGSNSYGQTNVPANLTAVAAISAGFNHSLALKADGTVVAWGDNSYGQAAVPDGLTNVAALAAGGQHSLALLADGPPFLLAQPVGRAVFGGKPTQLTVAASGASPLSYQWQLNGTNLPGATNAVLNLAAAQPAQAGAYDVVVSNASGLIVSSNAWLSVIPAVVVVQPGAQVASLFGTAALNATVSGNPPLAVQWQLNGTNLPGATNLFLALTNLQLAQAGQYTPLVTTAYGLASASASLAVVPLVAWGAGLTNSGQSPDYGQSALSANQTNLVAIACGQNHSLALTGNGRIIAWGSDSVGQCDVPGDMTNAVAIAAGFECSLALTAQGNVRVWGDGPNYQTMVPKGLSNVVAVASGNFHCLALKWDGTLTAWGDNTLGQSTVPAGLSNLVAVAGGTYHSLALKADGTVTAWGSSGDGQTTVPPGLSNVSAIACGNYHCLALKSDGTVVAWGAGQTNSGILPDYGQSLVPAGLTNVVAVAAGFYHSLALKADGSVVAWGLSDRGQTNVPVGLRNAAALAGGGQHSLALEGDGSPFFLAQPASQTVAAGGPAQFQASGAGAWPVSYQWQFNGAALPGATNAFLALTNVGPAQAGAYSVAVINTLGVAVSSPAVLTVAPAIVTTQPASQLAPVGGSASFNFQVRTFVPGGYQWQFDGQDLAGATNSSLALAGLQLAQAGAYHCIFSNLCGAVTSQDASLFVNRVAAWGDNTYGQTNTPIGLTNVMAIASGNYHSLALNADGTVVAWGAGLTNGSSPQDGQSAVPAGLSQVVAVAAGQYHSLALKGNGTVAAWGWNSSGQTNVPASLTNAAMVAGGYGHSLALRTDGTVVAWGYNSYGQTNVPAALTNALAIAAGAYHCLALRANGTVVAWGAGTNNGSLPPSVGQSMVPPGLANAVAIAAGAYHSLALKGDGTIVAWGYNNYGQTNVPAGLSNVVTIAAGVYYSLALKADGHIVAWGNTSVPATVANVTAIAAGGYFSLALIGQGDAPVAGLSPFLTTPLLNRTVIGGSTVGFRIGATGASPLNYQWRFYGTNLPSATNAVLVLTNVQFSQSGPYSVVVTNAFGSAASSNLLLGVIPVVIAVQPQSQSTCLGTSLTLGVSATGLGPFSYQWECNGAALAGATGSTLTLTNVGLANAGAYTVLVSDPFGSTTSAAASVAVGDVAVWGSGSYGQTNLPVGLTNVAAVASGYGHCLALKGDGTVTAWGWNSAGQTNVPASLTNAAMIAGGYAHSLALRTDGSVVIWGDNSHGQTNLPAGLTNIASVAAGFYHSLALAANGAVTAWGYNYYGQTNVPAGLANAVAIAAGGYYSLVLKSDGSVLAWGGQGLGETNLPPNLTNVVAISAGGFHALALRADGTVATWGSNTSGQTNVPANLSNVVAVAAGASHSLALKADGSIVVWGALAAAPGTISAVEQLAAGGGFAVALLGNGPALFAPLALPAGNGDAFGVPVLTRAGRVYRLEHTDSLTDGTWTSLPLVGGAPGASVLFDRAALSPQRFYRVRQW